MFCHCCDKGKFLEIALAVSFLFLVFGNVLSAQNTNKELSEGVEIAIGGVVKDASTKESLPFVTVVVRDENNKLIDNASTDNSGIFKSFFQKNSKFYTVEVAMIGFEHFVKKIEIQGIKKYYNLGLIFLKSNTELNTVYVTAPQLIKPSPDGYVYDVAADSTAKKKKVVQLLAKLPFIELDASNQPAYFGGSHNIAYMVNGKYDFALTFDKSLMKIVSGKKIKRIELVPNPPPAYSKSDVVINIVTEDESKLFEGLLFTPTLSYAIDSHQYSMSHSAKLTASTERFTYVINGGDDYSKTYADSKTNMTRELLSETSAPVVVLESSSKNGSWNNKPYAGAGVSYKISKKQEISAYFGLSHKRMDSHSLSDYAYYQTGSSSNNIYKSSGKNTSSNFRIDYSNGEFRKRDFSVFYSYGYSKDNNDVNSVLTTLISGSTTSKSTKRDNSAKDQNHSAGATFAIPVTKDKAISFKGKYDYTKNKNINSSYFFDETANMWNSYSGYPQMLNNSVQSGIFTASYSMHLAKFIILSLSSDLQYYKNKGNLETNQNEVISYHSLHLLPQVKLAWNIRTLHNITLSYSMGSKSPMLFQLDPTVNDSNPLYVSSGNPNLKDSKSDQVSLGYMTRLGKTTLSNMAVYQYTKGSINLVSSLGDDGVTYATYRNIGYTNVFFDKVMLQYAFTRKFKTMASITFQHNMYKSDTTRRYNTYNSNVTLTYQITRLMALSGSFNLTPVASSNVAQQTKIHYKTACMLMLSGNSKDMRLNYKLILSGFETFKLKQTQKDSYEYKNSSSSNQWYRVKTKSDMNVPSIAVMVTYTFGNQKGEN